MMSLPTLLLIGAGGHALSCLDVLRLEGRHKIAGFTGQIKEVGKEIDGIRVLGTDDDLPTLLQQFGKALVAVGQIESPALRRKLFQQIDACGGQAPVIVSPRAYVSPRAQLGAGTIVMHDAIINSDARIGRNCIVNTRALIEHGSHIEDHCHIATGAIVNGDSHVGAGTFIGSGAIVRNGVSIAPDSFIRMGELIKRDHFPKNL